MKTCWSSDVSTDSFFPEGGRERERGGRWGRGREGESGLCVGGREVVGGRGRWWEGERGREGERGSRWLEREGRGGGGGEREGEEREEREGRGRGRGGGGGGGSCWVGVVTVKHHQMR